MPDKQLGNTQHFHSTCSHAAVIRTGKLSAAYASMQPRLEIVFLEQRNDE